MVDRTAGRPVGLIQRYPIAAYPEYVVEFSGVCPVPAGALSIDYLIGDPSVRGQGLGALMISDFVRQSWAGHPQAHDIIVSGGCREHRLLASVGAGRVYADSPRRAGTGQSGRLPSAFRLPDRSG